MKNKLIRIALVVLALIVLVIISTVLLLTSSIGEDLVREWLERRLTAEMGLPVSIGRFETNLWTRVEIDSLVAGEHAVSTESAGTAIHIEFVRVSYSIPQLLGETVRLKALDVHGVDAGIVLDSLGRFGIPLIDTPIPDSADTGQTKAAIQIDTISFSGTNLSYHDPRLPLSVEIAGAEISALGHDSGLYSGRLTLEKILSSYDSLHLDIDEVEIAASLDGERVRIENARADINGLEVAGSGSLQTIGQREITFETSIDGHLDNIASSFSSAFDLPHLESGKLSAQLRVEGTLDQPAASLDAHVTSVVLDDISLPKTILRAEYHDSTIEIDTFQASVFGGLILGAGSISLDSLNPTSVDIVLEDIGVSPVWGLVYEKPSPYQGTLAGRIAAGAQGLDLSSLTAEVNISGSGLRYSNKPVPDLSCRATLKHSKVEFTLTHGIDQLYADVDLSGDALSGTFGVSIPDLTALARFASQPDVTGGLWADGTISGSYENPVIRSTIAGSSITYRNLPVDSVSAKVIYRDSTVMLERVMCHGSLDGIDPANSPFDIDSIDGSMMYTCNVQGSIDSLSGLFRAQLMQPQYNSYSVDSVAVEAVLDGSNLKLTSFDVFRDELVARSSVAYDTSTASGVFDVRFLAADVLPDSGNDSVVDSLEFIVDCGSIGGTFALKSGDSLSAQIQGRDLWLGLVPKITGDTTITDGRIEFELDVDGALPIPNSSLRATVRGLGAAGQRIDSVSTDMRLNRDALIIEEMTAYAFGSALEAFGRLQFGFPADGGFVIDSNASIQAELNATDFDLSVIEILLPPQSEFSGMVSAAVELSGTLESPRMKGWLSATKGRLVLAESPAVVDSIEIALSFADSILTIDNASCMASGLPLRATGSLTAPSFESVSVNMTLGVGDLGKLSIAGTASERDLNLDLLSDTLDLSIFQPFMTGIDSLSGTLGCQILVVGEMSEPSINGYLRLRALSLVAPRNYVRLSDGYADVRFDRDQVIVDSASTLLNDGNIVLSGSVTHENMELADAGLSLRAHSISFHQPEIYSAVIDSATLIYGKQGENYVLDGDVVIGEARLIAGIRLTSILPWIQSVETVDLELPELIARSRLDVRIRESDQLWVDNNVARTRQRAELGIIGTPLRPNFAGMIRIEEGYLLYLDRRFKVNQGVVYFNDPARFNPEIDLDASTDITVYRRTSAQPYTVYIRVEGPFDQLQYGLFSEPELEKPDIVALLTLGATRSELAGDKENGGQGGLKSVLADRFSMLTSQKVSGYLSRKAGSFFGFDEFTIQGNLFKFDDSWGPQLVASKRLSRRVDLTYSTTVGHLNDQTVRLGYRLTPKLSLQGETNRMGQAGIDLKYGITFK